MNADGSEIRRHPDVIDGEERERRYFAWLDNKTIAEAHILLENYQRALTWQRKNWAEYYAPESTNTTAHAHNLVEAAERGESIRTYELRISMLETYLSSSQDQEHTS